ncbi:MAG: glycoside hydrolase family 16 protein [Pyrinomonadaceae bacterium]
MLAPVPNSGQPCWRIKPSEDGLVWSDEFDYAGLPDSSKWGYDVGGHGWGNKELQYYTERRKENARVEKGHLIIEARRDGAKDNEYTSARLVSKGKGDWTYHSIGTQKTSKIPVPNARTEFNLYVVEWTSNEISWYINGKHFFTFANERLTEPTADYKRWPFDKPFHLILNLAVGGTWGGTKGVDELIWPQRMEIDYVRVYKTIK